MMAMGMSPSDIQAAQQKLDSLTKDAIAKYGDPRVVPVGVDGGGGYTADAGGAGGDNGLNAYLKSLRRGLSSADKAKMLAGKARIVGGEPIGVMGDDIFQMIHRRYDSKKKGNEFIEVAGVTPARKPTAAVNRPGFIVPNKQLAR
jgi:hypothetical protein